MSTEQNKALYRRFIGEAFNQGKLETVDELLAPHYVDYDAPPGTPPGPEGIKGIISQFRRAFPDLTLTIEQQVAEGDTVSSRVVMRGTHQGELFGRPATGRTVEVTGLTMVRFVDGRMVGAWVKNDQFALLQQLGFLPPIGAPAR